MRGTNNLRIGVGCSWVTPADKPHWVISTESDAPSFDERPITIATDVALIAEVERSSSKTNDRLREVEERHGNPQYMRKLNCHQGMMW